MTTTPLFINRPDGDGYDMAPAGVLLILANMVYGPQQESTWTGRPKTKSMIQAILAAARAGGYTQTDILHTLLSKNEISPRVKAMAVQACAAAGDDRIAVLFASMREGQQ